MFSSLHRHRIEICSWLAVVAQALLPTANSGNWPVLDAEMATRIAGASGDRHSVFSDVQRFGSVFLS